MKRLKVSHLLGKYNYSLNLEKECTILVGENGVGKSSFLSLLKKIADGEMIADIPFESISVASDTEELSVTYNYKLPSDCTLLCRYEKILLERGVGSEALSKRKYLYCNALQELREKNLLGRYLCEMARAESGNRAYYSLSIIRVLDKYFPEQDLPYCGIREDELSWGHKPFSAAYYHNGFDAIDLRNVNALIHKAFEHIDTVSVNPIYLEIYSYTGEYMKLLSSDTSFDIKEITNYFTEEIVYFHEKYVLPYFHEKYVLPYLPSKCLFSHDLHCLLAEAKYCIKNKTDNLPLYALLSLYKEFLQKMQIAFQDHVAYQSKKITPERIERLEAILGKYIYNKRVVFTPAGVNVYLSDEVHQMADTGIWVPDEKSEIGIDLLSAGERAIIELLVLAAFSDEDMLLIDEIDSSISIVWQKSLIEDMLEFMRDDNRILIVSTHSPYVIDREDPAKYIQYLPEEEMNCDE